MSKMDHIMQQIVDEYEQLDEFYSLAKEYIGAIRTGGLPNFMTNEDEDAYWKRIEDKMEEVDRIRLHKVILPHTSPTAIYGIYDEDTDS